MVGLSLYNVLGYKIVLLLVNSSLMKGSFFKSPSFQLEIIVTCQIWTKFKIFACDLWIEDFLEYKVSRKRNLP